MNGECLPAETSAKAGKAGSGGMGNYTVYANPYLVLRSGGYSKHYYIEGQRIVSKLGRLAASAEAFASRDDLF